MRRSLWTYTLTVFVLIFSEILPKAVAARHPRWISYAVALPLYLLHQLLGPIHILVDRLIEPVVSRVAGGRDGGHAGRRDHDTANRGRRVPE